jgi:hypothetical protein
VLQQGQRPLRLLLLQLQLQLRQDQQCFTAQGKGAVDGGFGAFGLLLIQGLSALQAAELRFAGAAFPVGMAAEGLLAHPQGLAVVALCHQLGQL